MNKPEISVIICTYNRGDRLVALLDKLKNQNMVNGRFDWELVLVDNNSIDDTRTIVKNYIDKNRLSINYVFEARQGKSFALNSGIAAAAGDCLAFTDDDVILDENWLANVYKAFTDYPQYNCFGGKVLPILEKPLPRWLSASDRKYRFHGGPLVSHDRGDQIKEYGPGMWVPIGSNAFVRKQVFEKYGGYLTQLGHYSTETLIYGEDSEIMFRFKKKGEAILYYPNARIFHPAPSERMKKSYFKKWCWGTGRGSARWQQPGPDAVRYFNIPRYQLREFIEEFMRWLAVLPGRREYKKFYHEMHLLYKLGMLYEFYIDGD